MGAAWVSLLLAAVAPLLVAGVSALRRRLRHEAVGTAVLVERTTGDLCLHEVCECNAARPCGDKRWSPRIHLSSR